MSEGKCALYLGAIFSTLFRIFSYIFLRVVCLNSSPFSSSRSLLIIDAQGPSPMV
jgi:hypothetical protein